MQLWLSSRSGTAPVGVAVEGFKINPHLYQSPLMLIWASCRSDLVAAVVRYQYELLFMPISIYFTVV